MHTFIIIISNEPALRINEPINQPWSRTINEYGLKSNPDCFVLILGHLNPQTPDTHPVSSEAIDQLLGAKVRLSFSLTSVWTKPGSVWEITAQDATWKPFISVKTRGFLRPCSHPARPPSPPLLPQAPVAAYLRLLVGGCGDHKPGRKHESLEERIDAIAEMWAWLFHTALGAKGKLCFFSDVLKRFGCVNCRGSLGTSFFLFFFCRAPCFLAETLKQGWRAPWLCLPVVYLMTLRASSHFWVVK